MVSVGDLKGHCSLPTYASERWWLWQASGQSWASGLLPKFVTLSRWWLSYRIKLSGIDCMLECVLEVQLSIRGFLLKMLVLETSGISAVGFLVSFTFLSLVWACVTEQVVSIETCLPLSWEFKETTRCGKAPCPVLFSACVFGKCSVQETVMCYL